MAPLALALYLALFAIELSSSVLWGPFSTIDEQLQYYQAGRNFAQYGFIGNAFLPDLSTGSAPAAHPYLYNHQPPGPQMLVGALIRLLGEHYRLIRLIFAGFFTLGMAACLRACRIVELVGLRYASLSFLLVRPVTVMHMIDHPAYSLFPLVAFLPIVALYRYHQTGHRWWVGIAAATVFAGSNYLIYGPLLMLLVFWTLGTLFRFLPMRERELVLLIGCTAAAVALHLLQSVAVLGADLFAKEVWLTISNRTLGRPTHHELETFYSSLGFVLYGSHRWSSGRFASAIASTLRIRAYAPPAVAVLILIAASRRFRHQRASVADEREQSPGMLGRISASVIAALLTPFVMFPAFSSDYGLLGMNEFLLGILAAASLGFAFRLLAVGPYTSTMRRRLGALLLAGIGWLGVVQIHGAAQVARDLRNWARGPSTEAEFLSTAPLVAGQVVMTNVDPTIAGFFTREVAFGGCREASLASPTPDPSQCLVRFIRGWPRTAPQPPAAYLWFAEGNAFCTDSPTCVSREDLDRRFKRLSAARTVAVYDLTTRRQNLSLADDRTVPAPVRLSHRREIPFMSASPQIPSAVQTSGAPIPWCC